MIYWTDCAVVIAAADIAVAEFDATAFVVFEPAQDPLYRSTFNGSRQNEPMIQKVVKTNKIIFATFHKLYS